jgi:hypothetical protein
MDLRNLLSHEKLDRLVSHERIQAIHDYNNSPAYSTRQSTSAATHNHDQRQGYISVDDQSYFAAPVATSPQSHSPHLEPKNVTFELAFQGAPTFRARLPMRVQIWPHDTTESIVTTVKNFYGLYEGTQGVSFEDGHGNTLIARYENLKNDMVVHVRIIPDFSVRPESQPHWAHQGAGVQRQDGLVEDDERLPPQPAQILSYGQPLSRPASRISRRQSASPKTGQRHHSRSAQMVRSRSGAKSAGSSFQAGLDELEKDALNGGNSSDGGAASVTSSRRANTAEISVENILEGSRRKKAKFDSSVSVAPSFPMRWGNRFLTA